jgi:hypothetical protein
MLSVAVEEHYRLHFSRHTSAFISLSLLQYHSNDAAIPIIAGIGGQSVDKLRGTCFCAHQFQAHCPPRTLERINEP